MKSLYLVQIFSFWIVTFLFWYLIIPFYIDFLKKIHFWQQIREEALIWKAIEFFSLHKSKAWTPSMWWAIILFLVAFMVLISIAFQKLWYINNSLWSQKETYLSLFTLFSLWLVWWFDDYLNIKWVWKKWISANLKMILLIIFSLIWSWWFYFKLWWNITDEFWNYIRTLKIPFEQNLELWVYFIPFFILVIIASANSVNITDWLDWLAWWLLLFCYAVYAYITFDQWLFLLSTLCLVIIWALLAFLWYNVKPAKFYMWDVWALSLWANLWIMAVITNTISVFLVIMAIFIFETITVIIQITSKKLRNWKKVFKIAPFHHHLEAIWWKEETIVFRFRLIWIILSVAWIIMYLLQ